LQEQNITSALIGVSNTYRSYGSYGSSQGILKLFADVAAVSVPSVYHTREARSNSNTHPLLVLHTKQKFTKLITIP